MARPDPTASFRALFSRDFSEERLSALLGLGADVPRQRLEQALLDPAAEFLARPGKRFRARLVEIGWSLVAPDDPAPIELPLAVEILHAASLIVDDIQDGSSHRRGSPALHQTLGVPLALNAGNWLYFWPFELVSAIGLPPERELELRRRMTRTLFRGHFGQALDLSSGVSELDQEEVFAVVRAATELKTGRLMELAASIGAVASGAPSPVVAALERFGLALGAGLQMLDDLGNLDGRRDPSKRHEDLRMGRPTWVWVWLAEQLAPDDFRSLQRRAARVRCGEDSPQGLARVMARMIGDHRRGPVHAHLESAFSALREELGPKVKLTELREEIRRLESSYV
ncbi:MAG: polyprenyl synthetase family protein [Myxococcota bacterium]|nr:polyprenyl synthetase family protein [Myxococcota bacterium]